VEGDHSIAYYQYYPYKKINFINNKALYIKCKTCNKTRVIRKVNGEIIKIDINGTHSSECCSIKESDLPPTEAQKQRIKELSRKCAPIHAKFTTATELARLLKNDE